MNLKKRAYGVLLFSFFICGNAAITQADNLKNKESLIESGAKQIKSAEMEIIIKGKTAYTTKVGGKHDGKKRNHEFKENGKLYTWNVWNNKGDGDKWFIKDDNQFCRKYNKWIKGKTLCREMYELDGKYYWVEDNGKVCTIVESMK